VEFAGRRKRDEGQRVFRARGKARVAIARRGMRLKPCELAASFLRREDACDRFIDPGGLRDRDDKYSSA
jgi:hypothetical protein